MAKQLVKKQGFPVKSVCGMLDLARSSYSYHPQREGEEALAADLQVVAGQHPIYGTRGRRPASFLFRAATGSNPVRFAQPGVAG